MEQMWIVPRLTRGPAGMVKLSCTCVRWCGGAWRPSRPAYPWSLVDGFFLCFLLVTMSLWLERNFFSLENPALSEKIAPGLRPKSSVDPLLWMCGWGDLMQLQNSLGRINERITNSVKVTKCCGACHAFGFCLQGLGTCLLPLANALWCLLSQDMCTFRVKKSQRAHLFTIKLLEKMKRGKRKWLLFKNWFHFTSGIETNTVSKRSCLLSI